MDTVRARMDMSVCVCVCVCVCERERERGGAERGGGEESERTLIVEDKDFRQKSRLTICHRKRERERVAFHVLC